MWVREAYLHARAATVYSCLARPGTRENAELEMEEPPDFARANISIELAFECLERADFNSARNAARTNWGAIQIHFKYQNCEELVEDISAIIGNGLSRP